MDKEGYAEIIGVHEAQKQAQDLLLKAKEEIKILGRKTAVLEALAEFIYTRKN
jgi:geranylgeranyl pyrophosphate synthase